MRNTDTDGTTLVLHGAGTDRPHYRAGTATTSAPWASHSIKRIYPGLNGSGNTVWLVATEAADGRWVAVETFDTESEAASWVRWA